MMNKYFYKPYMAVVLCVLSVNPSVQADEHGIHIKINTQTGAINQLILAHYSLFIFSEMRFYCLFLYISYLQMFSFDLNMHEIPLF